MPHSWQIKKGRVWEYSVRFGERPLEHTQAYVRVVASQSLERVSELWAEVWRQMLVRVSMGIDEDVGDSDGMLTEGIESAGCRTSTDGATEERLLG